MKPGFKNEYETKMLMFRFIFEAMSQEPWNKETSNTYILSIQVVCS